MLRPQKQQARLEALFADEQHAEVEVIWSVYKRMITAHREADRKLDTFVMQSVIDSLTRGGTAMKTSSR